MPRTLTVFFRVILPFLGEWFDSGHRSFRARAKDSIRSNAQYQFILFGSALIGLIYVYFQEGLDFNTLKTLAMALAYVWGLLLAIYLMGHGLVALPRNLFRSANYGTVIRRLELRAPRVWDEQSEALANVQIIEATVRKIGKRRNSIPPELREWVDEISDSVGDVEAGVPLMLASEQDTVSKIPVVITERYLADVTRRLNRARHRYARFSSEWARLLQSAADTQTIINSAASKKLEFTTRATMSTTPPLTYRFVTPRVRYHIYLHILPTLRRCLAAACAAASVSIITSELTKSFIPSFSIVSRTIFLTRPSSSSPLAIGFGRQCTVAAWISYMCICAISTLSSMPTWRQRALVPRNTQGESAAWYSYQIARLTVPLAYNFLTFLPKSARQETIFYHLLGRWIDLTPLGKGFDYVFPVFILIPVCATVFNVYDRVGRMCGCTSTSSEGGDTDEVGRDGSGAWAEGRQLIERELSTSDLYGLSASSPSSTTGLRQGAVGSGSGSDAGIGLGLRSTSPRGHQAFVDGSDFSSAARTLSTSSGTNSPVHQTYNRAVPSTSRQTPFFGPGRNGPYNSTANNQTPRRYVNRSYGGDEDEEEDANEVTSFAHRLKNRIETTDWQDLLRNVTGNNNNASGGTMGGGRRRTRSVSSDDSSGGDGIGKMFRDGWVDRLFGGAGRAGGGGGGSGSGGGLGGGLRI